MTRPLFARFVRLDPPGSNPPSLQGHRAQAVASSHAQEPTPHCPFGGPIEESLGADRAVVYTHQRTPVVTGVCNPSRVLCPRLRGRYRGSCWGVQPLQVRPLQEHSAGCRRGRYRSTPLAAGAAATGGLRWLQARPLQEYCAAAGGWCLLQGYAIPL